MAHAYKFLANYNLKTKNHDEAYIAAQKCIDYLEVSALSSTDRCIDYLEVRVLTSTDRYIDRLPGGKCFDL